MVKSEKLCYNTISLVTSKHIRERDIRSRSELWGCKVPDSYAQCFHFQIGRLIQARACLKIHFRHLHAPLCGIFVPNSGYVARYAPFIRDKSPTKCDGQLPESNFQTRANTLGCEFGAVLRKWRNL
ncbi:DUF6783 domain-containing protein [uncultured Robinsoniella sp.]|uniref:DUF6783 domain-containing protein n=1 Tax=uncultured Robinsoniella sp. TaxID=904190 RepID=UPI00374EB3CF